MTKYISRAAIAAAALALGVSGAYAGTVGNPYNMTVSVTVNDTCQIQSAGPMQFSAVQAAIPFSAETATATVTVLCTMSGVSLAANGGTTNGIITERQVSNGPDRLKYDLYVPGSTTDQWGDETAGTMIQVGAGSTSPKSFVINGRLRGATPVSSGSYSDIVAVTLIN